MELTATTTSAVHRTALHHHTLEKPTSNISFLNQISKQSKQKSIKFSSLSLKISNLKVVSAKASNQGDNSTLREKNRKLNQPLKVAYQGVPGVNCEWAATKAYPDCEPVPYEQFDLVFNAVESGIADRAVLPVADFLRRSIHRNYDLLLQRNLYIVEEVRCSVKHCLLSNGVKIEDVNRFLSHPWTLEYPSDQYVAEDYDPTFGRGINQDDTGYACSFLMLAREPIVINPAATDRPFKTSIAFSLEEGPAMFLKALDVFDRWQIKLTRIAHKQPTGTSCDGSKPNLITCFDFEGSIADPKSQNAIGQLKEFATVRVLGSYPSEGPFDDVGDWSG